MALEGVVGYDDDRVRLKMQFISSAQKLLEGGSHALTCFGLVRSRNCRLMLALVSYLRLYT